MEILPPHGTLKSEEEELKIGDPDVRERLAKLLLAAKEKNEQAVKHLEQALEHLKRTLKTVSTS